MNSELEKAYMTLENYVIDIAVAAGKGEEYGRALFAGIKASNGILRELAYYHDYNNFLCEYKINGYTIADILVWQVDHFKAYMDRGQDMNRFQREKLFLEAFETMIKMEKDPEFYAKKMSMETGTDQINP